VGQVRHDRAGVRRGWGGTGQGGGQAGEVSASAEQVRHGRGGPGSGAGRRRPSGAVGGGGGMRHSVWKRCERERSRRKKGRGRVYSLMFIRLTHQPTNISGLAYVVAWHLMFIGTR
jgi:hypothetical protein